MLWVGERTNHPDEAHIAYASSISNPVGIKVGPSTPSKLAVKSLKKLGSEKSPGSVVCITRFGVQHSQQLHQLLQALGKLRHNITWFVDPMHGNTEQSTCGRKTRRMENILLEIHQTLQIHRQWKQHLAGIHCELTGEDVSECIGGITEASKPNLSERYESLCDPRLNYSQALELAACHISLPQTIHTNLFRVSKLFQRFKA